MGYQEEKERGKRAKGKGKKMKRKRKAELGIHLIKADHGITEGREPLATQPQIFPVGLAKAFIQPLDRKMKKKGNVSATVRDICKPTLCIGTRVNTKKFLFAISTPRICHKALPEDRLVTFDVHSLFLFSLRTLISRLFSVVHPGDRLRRLHRGDGSLIDAMALAESREK